MASVKVSIIFVILIYINSISTLNIHKSKRVLRKPIRVLLPPYSDISTENKYLLTATYGIKQNEEMFDKTSEETYYNEQVSNKSSEETYNIQENEQVPNISPEQTYNIKDDKQLLNTSSEQTYDIQDDEQVPTKNSEQTFNSEEEEQGRNKSSEQIYNTKEDKQERRKSSIRTESHENNFKNEYNNSKTQKIFPKRTEGTTPVVPIIENENYVFAYNGDYHYSYKGADGTQAFERGDRRAANEGTAGDVVVGGYSYKDKDGNDYSLTYTAGENGYRPVGAHLPTPPPIPPAIQRVLRILATKTTPEPVTESLNSYDYN